MQCRATTSDRLVSNAKYRQHNTETHQECRISRISEQVTQRETGAVCICLLMHGDFTQRTGHEFIRFTTQYDERPLRGQESNGTRDLAREYSTTTFYLPIVCTPEWIGFASQEIFGSIACITTHEFIRPCCSASGRRTGSSKFVRGLRRWGAKVGRLDDDRWIRRQCTWFLHYTHNATQRNAT
jgi:hypothetical protein